VNRNLLVTTSDFKKFRKKKAVLVDKTKLLHSLVNDDVDNFHFISRPRRFGKSLMCSTINHLFSGSSELFNGLWMKDVGEWDFEKEKCPVIHLDMSKCATETKKEFESKLFKLLERQTEFHGTKINEKDTNNSMVFESLIHDISMKEDNKNTKVVVIIDEYGNPILEIADSPKVCNQVQKSLREFYKVLKSEENYI
jgi:hypothetical protein